MEVEELYDEFGNYIGPDQSDSDSDSLQLPELNGEKDSTKNPKESNTLNGSNEQPETSTDIIAQKTTNEAEQEKESTAIVLAEDKEYYPSADAIFGPETEVLVEEEDAQAISEPVLAPIVEESSGLYETDNTIPPAKYSRAYLASAVLPIPGLIRNIALVGHLHHGKTSFADMLFSVSHQMPWESLDDRDLPVRYTDTRRDEQSLHISLKTTAATVLMQNFVEKSYGITFLDTPGHVNFLDEAIAAMTLVDGIVLLVDVAEGIMMGTEVLLHKAAQMQLDVVLVISKLDRLCVELRIPPADAYHKIRYIIDSVNEIIAPYGLQKLCPARGNVAFASSNEGVCFTLKQFARQYIESNGGIRKFPMNEVQLARRFWGDRFYDKDTRKFTQKAPTPGSRRTFVEFVLEPFYKLHTAVLSHDVKELTEYLQKHSLLGSKLDMDLGRSEGSVNRRGLDINLKALLREVNSSSYGMGSMAGFVDMLATYIKAPSEGGGRKLRVMEKMNTRELETESNAHRDWIDSICDCDVSGDAPMTAYVGKLLPDEKGVNFDCLMRILSGRVRVGDKVRVLGDSYDRELNEEDQAVATVDGLYMPCARFKVEAQEASAGQIVLVRGIDGTIFKSATIVSKKHEGSREAVSFRSVKDFLQAGVVKVAIEPIRPSELPKMVAALRQCVKSFPGLTTKVEESGEHIIVGSGELYMDCVLRDLRESFGKVEIKVSDPVVPFAETVSERSALHCYADTPNGQNKIVMVAEPLEETVLQALEDGSVESSRNPYKLLRSCGWDALASKSLWTFGPDTARGPNALLNDVLIEEVRRSSDDIRDSIVQGFCWATREGPLADEPVRSVKVRLIDTTIAKDETSRSAAQIIPTCRRVVYSSMLTANPRVMEPVYRTEIVCSAEAVAAAQMLTKRRRGVILGEHEVAGAPLIRLDVQMPVLDSFGFEPDLRNLTHGAAFCSQLFDHWGVVPGDPLDRTVELKPLEPAGRRELARECMVKTRRRKGMTEEVSLTKYFDDPLLAELAQDNEELRQLL